MCPSLKPYPPPCCGIKEHYHSNQPRTQRSAHRTLLESAAEGCAAGRGGGNSTRFVDAGRHEPAWGEGGGETFCSVCEPGSELKAQRDGERKRRAKKNERKKNRRGKKKATPNEETNKQMTAMAIEQQSRTKLRYRQIREQRSDPGIGMISK